MSSWRILALTVFILSVFQTDARARRSDEYRYRYDQLWSSTVRLIRVDYGFTLQDKDKDNGFLLFNYQNKGKVTPGNVELIASGNEDDPTVRVTLSVPQMPSYIERMMLDKLKLKLKTEYGSPPSSKRAKPKAPEVTETPEEEPKPEESK